MYVLYRTKKVIDVTIMIFWDGFMSVIIIKIRGSDVVWKNFVLIYVLAIYFRHNSGSVMCILLRKGRLGMGGGVMPFSRLRCI